jgi:hypothetical protein
MFRRRRESASRREPALSVEPLNATLDAVQRAKDALLSVVPGRRGPGRPLAEGLAGFETGLAEASELMPAWRAPVVEAEWRECRAALDERARRAERFRLEADPQGYEELYAALGEIMDPLGAIEQALARLRS